MAKENDIVLIYFEDKPLTFARIERISPDIKPNWYHVKLFILQVPLQTVTWILRDSYINGEEFTMNEKKMRLERVVCPEDSKKPDNQPDTQKDKHKISKAASGAKVISLTDLKKK